MRIASNKLQQFLEQPAKNLKAILLYGPNYGAIKSFTALAAKNILGDSLSELAHIQFEWDHIKDYPEVLWQEVNNYSFGVDKKLITIYNVKPQINESLKNIFLALPVEVFVILIAGELNTTAGVRKFFEEQSYLAASGCYQDEIFTLKQIGSEFLRTNGLRWEQGVIEHLCFHTQNDRSILHNELEKLLCYGAEDKFITLEIVKSLVAQHSEQQLEELWLELLVRAELKVKLVELERAMGSIGIIRSFANLIMRIYRLSSSLERGMSFAEAAKKLSPPIFFKNIPRYEVLAKKFSPSTLANILKKLLLLEEDLKLNNNILGAARIELLFEWIIKKL